MNEFRTLRADEIEVRPATIKNGYATLLLYIDSRAVTRLLDETVGAMNWTMDFYDVSGLTVGKMGIWDAEKEMWVYKCDTGSESNIEANKGLFSDVYKRCLSRWGVCELYSAPRIQVPDDGYGCRGYRVSDIQYDDDRNIVSLTIVNAKGKKVFSWKGGEISPETDDMEYKDNLSILKAFCSGKKQDDDVDLEQLKSFYRFYEKKADSWKGMFNCKRLWDRWMETAN